MDTFIKNAFQGEHSTCPRKIIYLRPFRQALYSVLNGSLDEVLDPLPDAGDFGV